MEQTTQTNDSTSQNLQHEQKVTKNKDKLRVNSKENSKVKNQINVLKKLDLDSAKLLANLKDKVNKKPVGRKIKDAEILSLAIRQITNEHILDLQQSTYSEKDRLTLAHNEYQTHNGKISLDQFIGKLMRGEIKLQNAST